MSGRIAIAGASGKLGFATLSALLEHDLIEPANIVCTTSSDSGAAKLEDARKKGVDIRSASWDDQDSWTAALRGVEKLFLISSARVEKDFHDAPPGQGREADHFRALEGAKKAGVRHVYYTSLAFANPSLSRVMKAHERTEQYLRDSDFHWTLIREGLYNESWPLYLGHYDLPSGDDRMEVPVAGDGKISWTAISDLGLASAVILAAPSKEWESKLLYLAQSQAYTLEEVAAMVASARGKEVKLKIVSRSDHEDYYVKDRHMEKPFVEWWSRTYDALKQNECDVQDDTLERLLSFRNVKPTTMQSTVSEMIDGSRGFSGR